MTTQTIKLYEKDPYQTSFSAVVLRCEPDADGFAVVLDSTAFYPEGGGQPCDTGTLNGIAVFRTQEKNGFIEHMTESSFAVGETVRGVIDWVRRFSLMQQHSGEHILSGLVFRSFGYQNVGFHMGADAVTVDFDGELTKDDLALLEEQANSAVTANITIDVSVPPPDELRSMSYRSKKELAGDVRIVSIPNCDVCACCGTHVARSGEIGLIKILSAQSYKGGTRVSMLCGSRAFADYAAKNKAAYDISALLSAKVGEIVPAVERVLGELSAQKQKAAKLQEQLLAAKAALLPKGAEHLLVFADDLPPAELRQYCMLLCAQAGVVATLSQYNSDAGFSFAVGSAGIDVRPLGKELTASLGGRGGGNKELVQGVLAADRAAVEAFFTQKGFVIFGQ